MKINIIDEWLFNVLSATMVVQKFIFRSTTIFYALKAVRLVMMLLSALLGLISYQLKLPIVLVLIITLIPTVYAIFFSIRLNFDEVTRQCEEFKNALSVKKVLYVGFVSILIIVFPLAILTAIIFTN